MKDYLKNMDKTLLGRVRLIGELADKNGLKAFIVGGTVRDLILKRKNLDLDVVVSGDAVKLARLASGRINGKVTVYPRFGTAAIFIPSGGRVDFARARREKYPGPGALPVVRYGNLRQDLSRRDFSINALALSINKDSYGQLIDEVDGLNDLAARRVRVLHDRSFIDDPTRILRGVRFEQRFGFRFGNKTLRLLKMAVREKRFETVKPPRYFAEFKKLLTEPDPPRYLKRLKQLGCLEFLMPGSKVPWSVLQKIKNRTGPLNKEVDLRGEPGAWIFYFMGLLTGIKRSTLSQIVVKFPFKKSERAALLGMDKSMLCLKALKSGNLSRGEVYELLKGHNLVTVCFMRLLSDSAKANRLLDGYLTRDKDVAPIVQGKDLIGMNVPPGEEMGRLLERVRLRKIDGGLKTKKQEMNFLRKYITGVV